MGYVWLFLLFSALVQAADPLIELNRAIRAGDRSRIGERARLLRERIRSHPREARSLLLSESEAARVRAADPAAEIETWQTTVSRSVSVADDFEGQRAVFLYDIDGPEGKFT